MSELLADRYQLVKSLGEGGMADVHLAIDTILNREVAVKILRGELSHDPVTLVRFSREANAASKLNHPNVVQVYDVGEVNERHYIVMEYIRGRSLKQLIQRRGALHKEEAVNIMRQLVSAIACAHSHNIIHRDIKPQNVLVKDDGTVKITDFGIAIANNAVQLTQNDSVLGSAHYLAPETTRGEPATVQIDIYALGIVFYELLSGTVPFSGDNPVQIAMKHLSEEIPSIREFNPSLPQSIENIIIKATVKNRQFRYQSADEMLKDLEECLNKEHAHDPKVVFDMHDEEQGKTRVITSEPSQKRKEPSHTHHEEEKPKGPWVGILLTLIGALVVTGIIYFSGIVGYLSQPQTLVVPDVSSMTEDDARDRLIEAGFTVNVTVRSENSDTVKANHIIKTSPSANTEVGINTEVTLIISKGPQFVIENYVGKKLSDVKEMLERIGVTVSATAVPSTEEKGIILSQEILKEGEKIDPTGRHNRIKFTYASEAEFVMINIIGKPIEEAKTLLEEKGAVVTLNQLPTSELSLEEYNALTKGIVLNSSVAVGTYYVQKEGASIILDYYE